MNGGDKSELLMTGELLSYVAAAPNVHSLNRNDGTRTDLDEALGPKE